jgi:hypothetical protein
MRCIEWNLSDSKTHLRRVYILFGRRLVYRYGNRGGIEWDALWRNCLLRVEYTYVAVCDLGKQGHACRPIMIVNKWPLDGLYLGEPDSRRAPEAFDLIRKKVENKASGTNWKCIRDVCVGKVSRTVEKVSVIRGFDASHGDLACDLGQVTLLRLSRPLNET